MFKDDDWNLVRSTPLFDGIGDDELRHLAADMKPRRFAAGQTVFYQNEPGSALYLVRSGQVRIYVHGEDGQEVSVIIYGPGDIFGELSVLDDRPRSATAEAMEDTELLVMSDDAFHRHLRSSHRLALNLMQTLSTRLRDTTEAVESLATLDVNRRLIKRLLYMAERHGVVTRDGIRIRIRLTQQALASLISTSRESTNRALRTLVRQGLVQVRQGRITLLKPEELEHLMSGENKPE